MVIIGLFALTIITSACFENFLDLPPAAGMMLGLTYLKFFSYYLQKTSANSENDEQLATSDNAQMPIMTVDGKIDYFGPMKIMNKMHHLRKRR